MGKPGKGRRLPKRGRGMDTRPERPSILVVCEGEQTERRYFEAFPALRAPMCNVSPCRKSPKDIVKRAIEMAKGKRYDHVWCVFDKDDVTAEEFNQAIQTAQQHGFQVAYSNPKFELWYFLHFSYHHTAIPREDYDTKLTSCLGEAYSKNHGHMYKRLLEKREIAIENAQRLLNNYHPHHPAQDDPCTTVHQLVQTLIEAEP